ncbi:peptide deformylase [Sphingomonas sp. BN140010]|uniref:Peptide deformylase n=1 Tax=Sphingomonas arvum TaxID=2992113 RepID=A0ABT3JIL4_9SPHN|nr:peptide deformylase [Sphingomonas sp. BN140010]MCW3798799.1 peptide deformylase [Sphingomonas sp. BN140010]
MSLLPIIEIPDPILRAPSAPVERIDEDLQRLIANMFETMYEAPGIGLAAVQVAVPRRLVVIDLQDPDPDAPEGEEAPPVRRPHVFINPEILIRSDARKVYNEGCLSIPEQYAEIERPDLIRLKWLDEAGQSQEGEFDGLMSVCLQHEVDHLDGVLFIDYLSRLKRDMIVKKVVKARGVRGGAAL